MKIGIFGRKAETTFRDGILSFFKGLIPYQPEIYIYSSYEQQLKQLGLSIPLAYKIFEKEEEVQSDFQFFFSLGGDGTMLETIRYVRNKQIPIIGLNTGRLGFLANVAQDEINESIDLIFKGEYTLDIRSLLTFSCQENPFCNFPYALNEITVQKHDTSLITIETYVNGEELNRYWADGLIFSTPTGSTAYSLSCGGPIVSPEVEAIIITPIASHNLTVRPLIIPNHKSITLKVVSRSEKYLITLDSQSYVFKNNSLHEIKLAPFTVALVRLPNHSFFQTIRKKMMWGADIRN